MEPDPSAESNDGDRAAMLHEIGLALQKKFGDREPSDEEARSFMVEWLVSKGKTADEANRLLDS